jgi:NADPH:quinone reductase-like Zn-dependent oxidoreductase
MSRIIHFKEYGGPEVLQIVDEEVPSPAADEVRIKVKALGLNRAESMWRLGKYVEDAKLPARLGYEASGIVDAVGSRVTGLVPGDAVSTIPAFSMNEYGVYGELVLAPAYAVVKNPAALSFEEAASIWMMFITAYGALVEIAELKAGDTVLIPAASSSVGLAAIQITRMLGGTAVALTRTGAKRQQLLDAGASYVIATQEQDLEAEVLKITGGQGARIVFDPVGGPLFPKLISSMTTGGILFVYGALSEEPTILPMLEVTAKQPIIRGYTIWSICADAARLKTAVEFVTQGLASGALKPIIAKTFPFDQIVEAHRYMEGNDQFGKIVVIV